MRIKELTKQDIEQKFSHMGDYVGMDYLRNCLNNPLDFDTKKFVLVKLCGLYEVKRMFSDAGKMMRNAAEINTAYQSKINDFVKSAELYIKGGNYSEADLSLRRAYSIANEIQKHEIKMSEKEFYKTQAKIYLQNDKRKNAMLVYEKVLTLDLNEIEKSEVIEKLGELYNCLGKIREYSNLKNKTK